MMHVKVFLVSPKRLKLFYCLIIQCHLIWCVLRNWFHFQKIIKLNIRIFIAWFLHTFVDKSQRRNPLAISLSKK